MEQRQASGNILVGTRRFLDTCDEAVRDAVLEAVPAPARSALLDAKRGQWFPAEHVSSVWGALADRVDQPAHTLEALGTFLGTQATSSFLRLVVKLFTPRFFAAQVPRLWSRDFRFGSVHVEDADFDQGRFQIVVSGMDGFPYFGAIGIGWFRHALEVMGETGVTVTVRDRDPTAEPNAETWRFAVRWNP